MATAAPMFRSRSARRKPAKKHGWNHGNKSTTQRGYGYRWQKLRQLILQRDRYLCQPCSSGGKLTVATEVDHVVPKCDGGTDDEDNLQAICETCHRDKTASESKRLQASKHAG